MTLALFRFLARPFVGAAILVTLACPPAFGQTERVQNGTDQFLSGATLHEPLAAPGEVFVTGASITLTGKADSDLHVMGFDASIESPVGGDLYAMAATVTVRAPVAEDLTAMGFSLRTAEAAVIGGNARLMAATVVIDGPVRGALTASGAEVLLNAAVTGDVLINAGTLRFGPEARIGGQLVYSAPAPATIPDSVIPAARVRYLEQTLPDMMAEMERQWGSESEMPRLPVIFDALPSMLFGAVLTLGFLVALSAALLAFLPERVEALRDRAEARPGLALLAGLGGLSLLFGLVPVAAMTLIGLPLVPIVILAAIVAWTLGYLLGLYVVALRIFTAFGLVRDSATLALRLLALTAMLVLMSLLNFIPVLGWLLNLALVMLGIGGFALWIGGGDKVGSSASASKQGGGHG